ncbi:hypothetical protein COCOBI_10-2830 [Coccomyxa sp. Obi]|nr:hypothetical protein COCOBI_10-2830 [Coccomyxa sp. Obi]
MLGPQLHLKQTSRHCRDHVQRTTAQQPSGTDVANLRKEVDKLQWQFDEDVQKSAVLFCLQNSADILYSHQQRPRSGTPDHDFFLSQLGASSHSSSGQEASSSVCPFMDCQPGQVDSRHAQSPAPSGSPFVQAAAPAASALAQPPPQPSAPPGSTLAHPPAVVGSALAQSSARLGSAVVQPPPAPPGQASGNDMESQPLPGGQATLQDSDAAGADPAFLGANADLNRPETINLDRSGQVESVSISANGQHFTYNVNNWTPFCCAIMTQSAVEAAIKWGHNSVLQLDSTFGSNAQKFPLFTLLAVDEDFKGVPLAFLVASHERVELIKEFLEAVSAKVKDPVLVDAMFRDLLELMRYTKRGMDLTAARQACAELAEAFCMKWAAQDTFIQYFRTEWMPKLEMVVQLFRDIAGCPINTTSHIEGWHSTLKLTFLSGKRRLTNRRLDWLLWTLQSRVTEHFVARAHEQDVGVRLNTKA